jgi:Flp pilus assembly protein TadB
VTSKLTDTGQQRAIEDVAERAAEKAASLVRPVTPEPSSSSERMYGIAEAVVERSEPAHMLRCEDEGPACKLGKRIEKMEDRLKTIEDARNVEVGERKANTRLMALAGAVGAALATVAGQLLIKLLFGKHGG